MPLDLGAAKRRVLSRCTAVLGYMPPTVIRLVNSRRKVRTSNGITPRPDPTNWGRLLIGRAIEARQDVGTGDLSVKVVRGIDVAVPSIASFRKLGARLPGQRRPKSIVDILGSAERAISDLSDDELFFLTRVGSALGSMRGARRIRAALIARAASSLDLGLRAHVVARLESGEPASRLFRELPRFHPCASCSDLGGPNVLAEFVRLLDSGSCSTAMHERLTAELPVALRGRSVAVVGPRPPLVAGGLAKFRDAQSETVTADVIIRLKHLRVESNPLCSTQLPRTDILFVRGQDLGYLEKHRADLEEAQVRLVLLKPGNESRWIGSIPVMPVEARAPIAFGRALAGSNAVLFALRAGAATVSISGVDLYSSSVDYGSQHLPRLRGSAAYSRLDVRQRRQMTALNHDLLGEYNFLRLLSNLDYIRFADDDFASLLREGDAAFAERFDESIRVS